MGLGVFCVLTYPQKGSVQGLGNLGWYSGQMRPHPGKMRPIWAICMKSGQKCSRIGGKNFNHQKKAVVFIFCDISLRAHCMSLEVTEGHGRSLGGLGR